MVNLLLDFPWSFEAILDADPDPLNSIHDFIAFCDGISLKPAPFVGHDEMGRFMERMASRRGRWVQDALRYLSYVSCEQFGPHRAIPREGPGDLRSEWERALRDQIGDCSNWRNPQIVVSNSRLELWLSCVQDHEARIDLEDQPGRAVTRIIVRIPLLTTQDSGQYRDAYRLHKYASADRDPWDVRHIYCPSGEEPHRSECRLPRPSYLANVALDELAVALEKLRTHSWLNQGKYWYVPPEEWDCSRIEKPEWRLGAFPEDATANGPRRGKRGAVDYQNRIWLWDKVEGHWDVQLEDGRHKRINHEGLDLG